MMVQLVSPVSKTSVLKGEINKLRVHLWNTYGVVMNKIQFFGLCNKKKRKALGFLIWRFGIVSVLRFS